MVPLLAGAADLTKDIFPQSLQKTGFFEQKLIGVRDTSKDTLNPRYQPESSLVFEVPTFWVDKDLYEIRMDESSTPKEIKKIMFRKYKGKEQVLISVHPEGFDYYPEIISQAQAGEPFVSMASASPRTLITLANDKGVKVGFYNKLSLNKRLGGNIRLIHKQELARSYFVTKLLSETKNLPADFGYYPEFLVMIPKNQDLGGTILRSIPQDVLNGKVSHIPFFALYASMPDGSKPLIIQMAENSEMQVDEYFQEKIVEPFLKQWMIMAFDQGITMEPHGQNTLFEVDAKGAVTGKFIHRDFGGFTVDIEYRKKLGLPVPELTEINGYTVKYTQEDVGYGLKTSLDLYFANVVANFGNRYEEWFKKGWVKKNLRVSDFHQKLIQSVESTYQQKTGLKVDLKGWLANLMEPMLKARDTKRVNRCTRHF